METEDNIKIKQHWRSEAWPTSRTTRCARDLRALAGSRLSPGTLFELKICRTNLSQITRVGQGTASPGGAKMWIHTIDAKCGSTFPNQNVDSRNENVDPLFPPKLLEPEMIPHFQIGKCGPPKRGTVTTKSVHFLHARVKLNMWIAFGQERKMWIQFFDKTKCGSAFPTARKMWNPLFSLTPRPAVEPFPTSRGLRWANPSSCPALARPPCLPIICDGRPNPRLRINTEKQHHEASTICENIGLRTVALRTDLASSERPP